MPSHDQQSHQQPQQQQQYVQVSTGSMTSGAHVLINNSVNTTTANTTSASILPPYSQAVSSNSIYPMTVKVEPQSGQHKHAAPSTRTGMSPPLSGPLSPVQSSSLAPIDMADQERIKLERKRLRNRIAASKCRRRKLERISRLEDKVKGLKGENSELSIVVNKLRDQVCSLKQQVMGHIKCGCQLMMPQ
ncbi:unnamed protein product [Oppiella nova]|uniref:BZIP domain-containing protein n=1 Tax=Oppiella nova TaxID=334625 RepID=A0A7R9QKY6_9ACAR|nr:unnamed protein product [Oppiella nova]CAG2167957.1 unnamed protein product [Oppiella nova]